MEFIPANIDIQNDSSPMSRIIDSLSKGQIVYEDKGLSDEKLSRIIENIMLKFDMPKGVFVPEGETLHCILGHNIITAIDYFVVGQYFKLTGLKYFPDMNGKYFDELAPQYKRRIKEYIWSISRVYRLTEKEVVEDIAQRYKDMAGDLF